MLSRGGPVNGGDAQDLRGKWRVLLLLALAEMLAMALWFSASAVLPQLTRAWSLSGAQQSWMTMSVQVGFVVGALTSALTNLADRIPADAFNKRLELQDSQAIYAMRTCHVTPYLTPHIPHICRRSMRCSEAWCCSSTMPARGCSARRATARGSSPGSCRCDV